jgi:cytochrome c oxidase cbb3-type subunit III
MAEKEVDAISGTETTGHEWDGLKELNTPLPKWWLYVFYATILYSLVYVVLMPTFPGWTGFLGFSSRANLVSDLESQRQSRAVWVDRFEEQSIDAIVKDPDLLQYAMAGGQYIFADNCAPCHGAGGAGAPGYPILADDDWMWGGTLESIQTIVRHGIRNTQDEDALISEMPAFGADELLTRTEIGQVTDHVLHLAGRADATEEGAVLFEENCASCHGEDGAGIAELGAPNLTNDIWLYGGSREAIVAQIVRPRHGVMPPWSGRLSEAEIKQVAIYVHSLGGGQ